MGLSIGAAVVELLCSSTRCAWERRAALGSGHLMWQGEAKSGLIVRFSDARAHSAGEIRFMAAGSDQRCRPLGSNGRPAAPPVLIVASCRRRWNLGLGFAWDLLARQIRAISVRRHDGRRHVPAARSTLTGEQESHPLRRRMAGIRSCSKMQLEMHGLRGGDGRGS
ncbi:hypothetical protein P280DRAFT_217690 [Massarina eburnea CBS 473.64]|uniref:Uncharacterized protein n=1 Tax=Massarina eburnea CBS 473.64 TaxID=1395130 RepID=A0A6A6S7F9_9PLEO|nr:hypothetical protein P280DRAFT_217690 [Massarina eburnea CBS 473.64]